MEQTNARTTRKNKVGRVASDKGAKTIIVVTELRTPHAGYGKIIRSSRRFAAHDERNEAKTGDLVRIVETRPLSANKRWRLVEILERAK
ncbi:MAG TPA: 30S ribosomal protein S17 [Candidatus Acidoferrales bacterium]|nr:30S ribosomal protein S17 [Candidatus Acidoferrales bacterium]